MSVTTQLACPDCDFVVPDGKARPTTSIAAHRRKAHPADDGLDLNESPNVLRGGRWLRRGLIKRWIPNPPQDTTEGATR